MLGGQDAEREEAAVFSLYCVCGLVHISHHNWGLLQTE